MLAVNSQLHNFLTLFPNRGKPRQINRFYAHHDLSLKIELLNKCK